jgi:hypothetical protein
MKYIRIRTKTPGKCTGCVFIGDINNCFTDKINCIDNRYKDPKRHYGIYIEQSINLNIKIL